MKRRLFLALENSHHRFDMRHILTLMLAFTMAFSLLAMAPDEASAAPWFVDADRAKEMLDSGATVLDARGKLAYRAEHIENAPRGRSSPNHRRANAATCSPRR